MERSKARPLQTLPVRSCPLAPQAIAWSCDAELAVATPHAITIFLPNFSPPAYLSDGTPDQLGPLQHQYARCLQFPSIYHPHHVLNRGLCAPKGIALPDLDPEATFTGTGRGPITGTGASMNQVVRIEWSPGGLGYNARPLLTAMLTNGMVIAMGEDLDVERPEDTAARERTAKLWKILWGIGGGLPIPDPASKGGLLEKEDRIKSFSWAREIVRNKAILAYTTDAEEVVIMGVQRVVDLKGVYDWEVREVARFDGSGCHHPVDMADPDFVPSGSVFSLKWSPWRVENGRRTAILAYLANNFVGFRRVTVDEGETLRVTVESSDMTSLCLFLSTDAFVEWEGEILYDGDIPIVRGMVATPLTALPFQVPLTDLPQGPKDKHTIWDCGTTYPPPDQTSTNPITGLVIHAPNISNPSSVPSYTLVRLSATAHNRNWLETNTQHHPLWTDEMGKQVYRTTSRISALRGLDSDSDATDDEDMEDMPSNPGPQIHPFLYRLWGLVASPGGRSTAVLVTKNSSLYPDRRGDSRLLFDQLGSSTEEPTQAVTGSTEGRLWEWMYGNGAPVPGTMSSTKPVAAANTPRDMFHHEAASQRCVFCAAALRMASSEEATCENGHSFAMCPATGLAIMEPGVSRVCNVCGRRTMQAGHARKLVGESFDASVMGDRCAGCHGKFVA